MSAKTWKSRTKPDATVTFLEIARNHGEHAHCVGCGHCLVDPSDAVRFSSPVWCVSCRDKVRANIPSGQVPWTWTKNEEHP